MLANKRYVSNEQIQTYGHSFSTKLCVFDQRHTYSLSLLLLVSLSLLLLLWFLVQSPYNHYYYHYAIIFFTIIIIVIANSSSNISIIIIIIIIISITFIVFISVLSSHLLPPWLLYDYKICYMSSVIWLLFCYLYWFISIKAELHQ